MIETHKSLVEKAAMWLKKHNSSNIRVRNCPHVYTELVTAASEVPDVMGFCTDESVLIEVKTSREDFFQDQIKPFRNCPENGMGNKRFYACPTGLIQADELPDKWGLLEWDGSRFEVTRYAESQPSNLAAERIYLVSVIRRSGAKG